ncbi:hypothetical protein CK203_004639 [Vitis vinifera]|uniref:Uncharacterized protein n=1 Tax=Vitis vinifera TaxID=29760 RepID=A0A438KFH4_VITVI|nr:hypothetical protein CK203_004639 [Vitis vinifera]
MGVIVTLPVKWTKIFQMELALHTLPLKRPFRIGCSHAYMLSRIVENWLLTRKWGHGDLVKPPYLMIVGFIVEDFGYNGSLAYVELVGISNFKTHWKFKGCGEY